MNKYCSKPDFNLTRIVMEHPLRPPDKPPERKEVPPPPIRIPERRQVPPPPVKTPQPVIPPTPTKR